MKKFLLLFTTQVQTLFMFVLFILFIYFPNLNDEINLFKCFTSKFDLTEENLKRKYEHTYRVAQYAEEIATSCFDAKSNILA